MGGAGVAVAADQWLRRRAAIIREVAHRGGAPDAAGGGIICACCLLCRVKRAQPQACALDCNSKLPSRSGHDKMASPYAYSHVPLAGWSISDWPSRTDCGVANQCSPWWGRGSPLQTCPRAAGARHGSGCCQCPRRRRQPPRHLDEAGPPLPPHAPMLRRPESACSRQAGCRGAGCRWRAA